MQRTVLVMKIKELFVLNLVPRILKGSARDTAKLKQISVCVSNRTASSTVDNNDESETDRCQRIIDRTFEPNGPFNYTEYSKISQKEKSEQSVIPNPECTSPPDKTKQCEICKKLIIKIFGDDKPNIDLNKHTGVPLTPITLQATTDKQTEEKLAQKLEIIEETPLVEAQNQIEGFNQLPKVLGKDPAENENETLITLNFSTDKTPKCTSRSWRRKPRSNKERTFDDIAERCLDTPQNKIDERILKEIDKLGCPSTVQGYRGREDKDIIQTKIMKKPPRPVNKIEMDWVAKERNPQFDITNAELNSIHLPTSAEGIGFLYPSDPEIQETSEPLNRLPNMRHLPIHSLIKITNNNEITETALDKDVLMSCQIDQFGRRDNDQLDKIESVAEKQEKDSLVDQIKYPKLRPQIEPSINPNWDYVDCDIELLKGIKQDKIISQSHLHNSATERQGIENIPNLCASYPNREKFDVVNIKEQLSLHPEVKLKSTEALDNEETRKVCGTRESVTETEDLEGEAVYKIKDEDVSPQIITKRIIERDKNVEILQTLLQTRIGYLQKEHDEYAPLEETKLLGPPDPLLDLKKEIDVPTDPNTVEQTEAVNNTSSDETPFYSRAYYSYEHLILNHSKEYSSEDENVITKGNDHFFSYAYPIKEYDQPVDPAKIPDEIADNNDIKPNEMIGAVQSTANDSPENIADNVLKPLFNQAVPATSEPNFKRGKLSLTEMMNIIRERNRMELCKEFEMRMQGVAVEGKCGDKKPMCPPPAKTCPPPPPKPCPPKPPCPYPCKPKCPSPCVSKPCPPPKPKCPPPANPCDPCKRDPNPPKKSPCDKFSSQCEVSLQLSLMNVGQPSHIPIRSLLLVLGIPDISTGRHTDRESRSFERLSLLKFDVIFARNYDPWSPIPSWPISNDTQKKKFKCPKEGCKERPPSLNPPCRQVFPCDTFPKTHSTPKRFSLPELLSMLFAKKVGCGQQP